MLRLSTLIVGVILLSGCHPMRGFLESEFDLSGDSRLPIWFASQERDQSREEFRVILRYYTSPFEVDDSVLALKNKYGLTIATVTGTHEWHSNTLQVREKCSKLSSVRPSYVVFTAEGKSEIIEHRKMEPIFYVVDEKHVQKYPSQCNAPNKSAQPDALTRAAGFSR